MSTIGAANRVADDRAGDRRPRLDRRVARLANVARAAGERTQIDRQDRGGFRELAREHRPIGQVAHDPLLAKTHRRDERERDAADDDGDHELDRASRPGDGACRRRDQHGSRVRSTTVLAVPATRERDAVVDFAHAVLRRANPPLLSNAKRSGGRAVGRNAGRRSEQLQAIGRDAHGRGPQATIGALPDEDGARRHEREQADVDENDGDQDFEEREAVAGPHERQGRRRLMLTGRTIRLPSGRFLFRDGRFRDS